MRKRTRRTDRREFEMLMLEERAGFRSSAETFDALVDGARWSDPVARFRRARHRRGRKTIQVASTSILRRLK